MIIQTEVQERIGAESIEAPPYPGIPTTVDGSEAAIWVETHICEGACAYPITPSTPMGDGFQAEVARGKKNLWGQSLFFLEPESEHSSASACEGFALAGGRVANFTSGQGLVLMKEVLHVISGKRLPMVFHIGARTLTSQGLCIHAGHDDVMAVADTGWGILFARNAQEVADLALIARRAAEDSETPFMVVQDGFLGTHTVESVLLPEPELMEKFVGQSAAKLRRLFDPSNPVLSGPVQNQDAYMKGKVAQRYFYDRVLEALRKAMDEFARLTGRTYHLVDAYRLDDAEYAFVGLATLAETAAATADWLRRARGLRIGVLHPTSFRPFPAREVVTTLRNCRAIAIIERMDNPLADSNPLGAEIKAAFAEAVAGAPGYPKVERMPIFYSGIAGLGSRDLRPGDLVAVASNFQRDERRLFVLGIKHPLALARIKDPDVRPPRTFSMRGHSIGGFGSVTTNKVIASIAADLFGKQVQAYPKYGSEKKGLPTNYYLTVADEHVRTHIELEQVEFVALHDSNAFNIGDPLAGLVPGGILFLNTDRATPEEVWATLPPAAQRTIAQRRIRVFALDTLRIARDCAPTPDLLLRMQGIALLGVFLRVAPFREERGLSQEALLKAIEKSLRKYFGKRGEAVIEANMKAVQRGFQEVFEVPAPAVAPVEVEKVPEAKPEIAAPAPEAVDVHTAPLADAQLFCGRVIDYYNRGAEPELEADVYVARSLLPPATAALRDFSQLAPDIPEFIPDKCVGCMECVTQCPDTAILAKVVEPATLEQALAAHDNSIPHLRAQFTRTQKYYTLMEKKGTAGGLFGIFIDPSKCKGCGECVVVCGTHEALRMVPKSEEKLDWYRKAFTFFRKLPPTPQRFISERALADIMLLEHATQMYVGGAGSCMGCGEATAIRMLLAATAFQYGHNSVGLVAATGCNTVYGSTYPFNPFAVPWTNSLFENVATDAMGIRGRWDQIGWKHKRLWALGGDGALYDIGMQALSRLLVSGMDIKVLVLDTQVYSNTGGQASGATFTAQAAKMSAFGAAIPGKVERRKELGLIALMHPHVFVAQTTPAFINHFYRAVMEANAFPGPAVIVSYATCQPEHGVGDDQAAEHAKLAVESRAFPLFIYDPRKGERFRDRLDLKGNPAMKEDWYLNPKTGEPIDFIYFARTEGRFAKHFDAEGKPSPALLAAQEDRLENWRRLQELAGLR